MNDSEHNDFQEEEEEFIDIARQQRLIVLIWGPGKPGENSTLEKIKGYEKRRKIQEALKERFPRSEFKLSEDYVKPDRIKSSLDQEANQAAHAHLVLILDISRGADLELDYFTKYSWFRGKVWLLLPQEYLDSPGLCENVYQLIPEKQKQGYTPEEFDRCDVAKVMSVKIVEFVAFSKLLNLFQR